jgi:hypothetical protein
MALPRDYDGGDDPVEARLYLQELHAWEKERDRLAGVQADARAALEAAQQRVTTLNTWATDLQNDMTATTAHGGELASIDAAIASATAAIAVVDDDIADIAQAHEIATARLLGGPPSSVPIALLPVRLETHWDTGTLHVRIYPDVLSVDGHDPRLTPAEQAAGARYWEVRGSAQPVEVEQAWMQLVRSAGPQRAAWIVHATVPNASAAEPRNTAWTTPLSARLLPDRFAVVALSAGEPVNIAPAGASPRYVTWTAAVTDPLPCGLFDDPGTATWMTNLATARDAGMAVRIPVPAGAPPFDTLVVIGIRAGGSADLVGLLDAHSFTDGLDVLADGIPSNNSSEIRAAHSPRRDAEVAHALIDPERAANLTDGTAGAQLADLLGIPRARLAPIAGADQPREPAIAAARLLVGLGTAGALRDRLGTAGVTAWPLVTPTGPAPTLRVGRQPYGILPVTAPGRWQPHDGETSAPLAVRLREWALATGPATEIDPGAPPAHLGDGPALHVTRTDDTPLAQLLLQTASTLRWSADGTTLASMDTLVGPADGDQGPAMYLERIAATAPADLAGIASSLPPALLARVALTAKQRLLPPPTAVTVDEVNAALRALAALAGQESGRADLARLLTEMLDACSHRFDAWVTGATTERLHSLRSATPDATAVGAFGWLTDVQPRGDARSHGHVHAPSLGHAATAAVLRSGFLGQRRRAWAAKVAQRQTELDDAQAEVDDWQQQAQPNSHPEYRAALARLGAAQQHLADARDAVTVLPPLDAQTEANLPLAIDLSSRRVRAARRTLRAVRAGQPLAAVLGYQFERDLSEAGLQRYLAAFRKLTRFHTGTALEALENTRHNAAAKLYEAQHELTALRATADQATAALGRANDKVSAAQADQQQAETAAAPYLTLQSELKQLDDVTIPQLEDALASVEATRPVPGEQHHTIKVPDI